MILLSVFIGFLNSIINLAKAIDQIIAFFIDF